MTNRPSTTGRRSLSLAVVLGLLAVGPALAGGVRPGGGTFGTGATRPPVADGQARFHVLNRVTYGPSAESLAEIRAVGVDEFLRRQLNPVELDDGYLDGRLAAEVAPWTADCILPDSCYRWNDFYYERLIRARYSNRQLQIMVQFWENHFDTVVVRGNNEAEQHLWTAMEWDENRLFRENALGRFRDLLEISAKSQAMMYFLDNFRSSVFTLNENYARELLELHSLGVDCGYNQTDVIEVAPIFTGWSGLDLPGPDPGPRDIIENGFLFRAAAHDATAKWPDPATQPPDYVPGILVEPGTWPPGGMLDEGERVLDVVSRHPCTARFIATKLLQTFVTDYPSDDLVDRISHVFLATDGDIKAVLRAIFDSPEFSAPASFDAKVRTPIEFTMAALRATDGHAGVRRDGGGGERELYYWIQLQGMDLFDYPIPTGYYEAGAEWISANGFLNRWKFAESLTRWFNQDNRPNYIDPLASITTFRLDSAEAIVDHFGGLIAGPSLTDGQRAALVDILTNGTGVWGGNENDLRQMISHLLGSPQFMQQ